MVTPPDDGCVWLPSREAERRVIVGLNTSTGVREAIVRFASQEVIRGRCRILTETRRSVPTCKSWPILEPVFWSLLLWNFGKANDNWATGIFRFTNTHGEGTATFYEAAGVEFEEIGLCAAFGLALPTPPALAAPASNVLQPESPDNRRPVAPSQLKTFCEAYLAVHGETAGEDRGWAVAKEFFHANKVSRGEFRRVFGELRGPQTRGRKRSAEIVGE